MQEDTPLYDLVVVGYGVAGACAAIEAADAGARVLVLDRGYGGGATALSGGVVYAGGGTRHQSAAGLQDTPEEMFKYLRQEVGGVVSDDTLRTFCEGSPAMIDWLEHQGARYQGSLAPYKTSYPTDAHYLYYSGNEKAWPYRDTARPAARGHRQVAKGLSSGHDFFEALRASAMAKGVEFQALSRVDDLVLDADGAVQGVRYRRMDLATPHAAQHERLTRAGAKLANWVPPIGRRLNSRAEDIWESEARSVEVRAGAVVLSAGGFVFNSQMKQQHEGGFTDITPLGTVGDDGSGIELGVSAGGSTAQMNRMTAWRFMSPPSALLEGVSIGPSGARIANEDLYGATHSDVMVHEHQARGYLILDSAIWRKARSQVRSQTQSFQAAQAAYLFTLGHRRASSLDKLARKIGVSSTGLSETVTAYNEGVTSEAGDPGHKAPELTSPLVEAPFYAINISIKNSLAYPAAGLTLGGLRVNETSGEVLTDDGDSIRGLYAAGRSAVGICSNSYISGLSLADGVFSGRRAGAHASTQARVLNRASIE